MKKTVKQILNLIPEGYDIRIEFPAGEEPGGVIPIKLGEPSDERLSDPINTGVLVNDLDSALTICEEHYEKENQ